MHSITPPSETVSNLDSQAPRTATILIKNNLNFPLAVHDFGLDLGEYREHPLIFIKKGTTARLISQSNALLTGTAGHISYYIADGLPPEEGRAMSWVSCTWNNPFASGNSWTLDWFDRQGNGQNKNSTRFNIYVSNSPSANDNDLIVEYTLEEK